MISPEDLSVIVEAVRNETDIIPLIPTIWLDKLKGKSALIEALADADFLLGLTDEILPEYSNLLKGRQPWLERQLCQLKEVVEL